MLGSGVPLGPRMRDERHVVLLNGVTPLCSIAKSRVTSASMFSSTVRLT